MYLPVGFIPMGVSSVWEEVLAVDHAVDEKKSKWILKEDYLFLI